MLIYDFEVFYLGGKLHHWFSLWYCFWFSSHLCGVSVTAERTPILAFVGKRGSGKTLLMSIFIAMDQIKWGTHAWTNYGMSSKKWGGHDATRMSGTFLKSFFETKGEAFLKTHGGILAIDELATFLDAYSFRSKKNVIFSMFLMQTRKRNVSLYFTTQQMNMVPIRIRNNTDRIIRPFYDTETDIITYDIFDFEPPLEIYVRTLMLRNASKWFGLYSTTELIDVMGDD